MYRIAIDVGGTFTDVVAADSTGIITYVKAPSTPANQSVGVLDGLNRLAERLQLSRAELLSRTERIVHGMTVATNALLERKGAKLALLTTAGHRDILEMREGLKPDRYNLRLARPETLVPRSRRLGIVERLRADGSVHTALDMKSVDRAIDQLIEQEVSAVAVCFLHAYKDSRHEELVRARLAERLPELYMSLSSEVLPQIKEYQRVSTTVVNAYVGPLMRNYLADLEQHLAQAGYPGAVLVMLSHGGVAPVEEAIRVAAGTVLSGPAGGIAGARRVAALTGIPNLIPLDMGGTSTDISLIVDGQATLSAERAIASETIALPSLDIITLGAGGGSIARRDTGGLFKVGPQSAGADPGPASYGRGGLQATVTDASVVLGYLTPQNFMGGSADLNQAAATEALQQLADQLGLSAVETAAGVHRIINTHMAEGIRLATVRRGVDPRNFALLGFGGAAGLHATALARMLNLRRVVIPEMASVLSAWGMLETPLRFENMRSHVGETDTLDVDAVRAIYAQLRVGGRERMRTWFDGEIVTELAADMRYGEQVYEIDVPFSDVDLHSEQFADQLKAAFERRHEALYTYSLPDQQPVLVNARVATTGLLAAGAAPPGREPQVQEPLKRRVYLDEWAEIPVFSFAGLASGSQVNGPAMVESETTTVLLRDGDCATVTAQGWLDIQVTEATHAKSG